MPQGEAVAAREVGADWLRITSADGAGANGSCPACMCAGAPVVTTVALGAEPHTLESATPDAATGGDAVLTAGGDEALTPGMAAPVGSAPEKPDCWEGGRNRTELGGAHPSADGDVDRSAAPGMAALVGSIAEMPDCWEGGRTRTELGGTQPSADGDEDRNAAPGTATLVGSGVEMPGCCDGARTRTELGGRYRTAGEVDRSAAPAKRGPATVASPGGGGEDICSRWP